MHTDLQPTHGPAFYTFQGRRGKQDPFLPYLDPRPGFRRTRMCSIRWRLHPILSNPQRQDPSQEKPPSVHGVGGEKLSPQAPPEAEPMLPQLGKPRPSSAVGRDQHSFFQPRHSSAAWGQHSLFLSCPRPPHPGEPNKKHQHQLHKQPCSRVLWCSQASIYRQLYYFPSSQEFPPYLPVIFPRAPSRGLDTGPSCCHAGSRRWE